MKAKNDMKAAIIYKIDQVGDAIRQVEAQTSVLSNLESRVKLYEAELRVLINDLMKYVVLNDDEESKQKELKTNIGTNIGT